jgi:hypothetical protein
MDDGGPVSRMAYPLRRFLRRALPVFALLFAATVTLLVGYLLGRNRPLAPTHNRIQVRVLNVQQGEASILRTGGGKFIVIGAGPPDQGVTVNAALKEAGAERIVLLVLPLSPAGSQRGRRSDSGRFSRG